MSKENKEQEILNELNKTLKTKSINKLLKESKKLSTALHKLPWFALFFEEDSIEGHKFTTEENRYEIVKTNADNYIVRDRSTGSLLVLPKQFEEEKYVLGGSFNLDDA